MKKLDIQTTTPEDKEIRESNIPTVINNFLCKITNVILPKTQENIIEPKEKVFIIPKGRQAINDGEISYEEIDSLNHILGNYEQDKQSFINYILLTKEWYGKKIKNVPRKYLIDNFALIGRNQDEIEQLSEKASKTIDNLIEGGYMKEEDGNISLYVRMQSIHEL